MRKPVYTAAQIRQMIELYQENLTQAANEQGYPRERLRLVLETLDRFGMVVTKIDDEGGMR